MKMRCVAASLLLFVLAVAFLPLGTAQAPQPQLHILHDVADDGYTYVGNPAHFGYILLTADEKTTTHRQGRVTVVQNGLPLYQTSADGNAGHDYDALNTFQIAFPTTGPYEVLAEVPVSSSLTLKASFAGFVHPVENPVKASLDVKAPPTAAMNVPAQFTYALRDESGALLEHSDVLFEVRRASDGFLVFRTHTHSHDDVQTLQYAFAQAGEYKVRLTGYQAFPSKTGAAFEPVTRIVSVRVTDGGPMLPSMGSAPPLPAAKGGTPYVLLTTIDPQRQSNPFSQFRISALVYDPVQKTFVPHVNFAAQVVAESGRVLYRSESLHEYDGNYDLVLNVPKFGGYVFQVVAQRGDWSQRADLPFQVAPAAIGNLGTPAGPVPYPMPPGAAGPMILNVNGLQDAASGQPTKLIFQARTLAGTPAMHSELEFQVVPESLEEPAYLTNKLHTHASGDFQVDVVFPTHGRYLLVIDPETVHGDPTPSYYYRQVGGLLQVPFEVRHGVDLPAVLPDGGGEGAAIDAGAARLPAPAFGWAVLVLAVLVLLAGRRPQA